MARMTTLGRMRSGESNLSVCYCMSFAELVIPRGVWATVESTFWRPYLFASCFQILPKSGVLCYPAELFLDKRLIVSFCPVVLQTARCSLIFYCIPLCMLSTHLAIVLDFRRGILFSSSKVLLALFTFVRVPTHGHLQILNSIRQRDQRTTMTAKQSLHRFV